MVKWDQDHREQAGTLLQVHAWDTLAERLVRIDNGESEALRPWCASERLICPYPGCPDARFTTAREYTNRWGTVVPAVFRHRSTAGTGHEPESWYHLTAKLLVADWLRAAYPEWQVEVERTVDTGPRRRPDVSAQRSDGTRVAVEVQYSPIDPIDWSARSADLTAAGYVPVWFWGHRGSHFRAAQTYSEGAAVVQLGALQQQAWRSGARPHWIDPELERVLSAAPGSTLDSYGGRCEVGVDPLSVVELVGDALVTPTDRAALAEEERLAAEEEAERQRELLRTARAEAAAEAERQRRERLANESDAERQRREAFRDAARAADAAAWERSTMRRELVEKYGGVPEVIAGGSPNERNVFRHPEEWRAAVFMDMVQGHVGQTLPYGKFTRRLLGGKERADRLFPAVTGFLFMLRKAGYVAFDNSGLYIVGDITVTADLDHPPTKAFAGTSSRESSWRGAPAVASTWSAPPVVAERGPQSALEKKVLEAIEAIPAGATTTTSEVIQAAGLAATGDNRRAVISFLLDLRWAKRLSVAQSRDFFQDGPISVVVANDEVAHKNA
jgi:hypothetical protein